MDATEMLIKEAIAKSAQTGKKVELEQPEMRMLIDNYIEHGDLSENVMSWEFFYENLMEWIEEVRDIVHIANDAISSEQDIKLKGKLNQVARDIAELTNFDKDEVAEYWVKPVSLSKFIEKRNELEVMKTHYLAEFITTFERIPLKGQIASIASVKREHIDPIVEVLVKEKNGPKAHKMLEDLIETIAETPKVYEVTHLRKTIRKRANLELEGQKNETK